MDRDLCLTTTALSLASALTLGSAQAAVITFTNDTVVSSALEGKQATASFQITANGKLTITDVLIDPATFITGDKDDMVTGLSIANDKCDGKTLNAKDSCTFDVVATTDDKVKDLPNDFGRWLGVPVVFWNDGGAKDQSLGAKDRILRS
jgi:hypothetical protein